MDELKNNILVCGDDALNQTEKQRIEKAHTANNEEIRRDKTAIGYFCVLVVAVILSVTLFLGLKWIYIKHYHIDATEKKMHKILMQIENGEMVKASEIEYMLEAGFDGLVAYNRLAYIYEQQGDYDKAVDIIMYYIENNHGMANVSNNPNFIEILELHKNDVTKEMKKKLERFLENIHCYRKMYELVRNQLYKHNYESALATCLELKADGANSFEFACLYTEVLIELERKEEAFTYVKDYVKDYSTFQNKETSAKDREKLLQFIRPNLQGELQAECDKLIEVGFDEAQIHAGIQYPKKYYIGLEAAEELVENCLIGDLQWLSLNDEIFIDEEYIIYKGIECFPVHVVRKDGEKSKEYTLYLDTVADNIFIAFGDEYSNIYRGVTWWGTKQNEIVDKTGIFRNFQDENVILELTNYRYLSENYSYEAIEFIAQGNDPEDVPLELRSNEYGLDIRSYYDDEGKIRLEMPESVYIDAVIRGYSDDTDIIILLSDRPTLLIKKDYKNTFANIEGIYKKY